MPTVTVSDNPVAHRYEVFSDGTLAGFSAYADRGNERVVFHTEVAQEYGGHGLGTILVTQLLEHIRSTGRRVVPVCPMVSGLMAKHPDRYVDVADPVTPDVLDWLQGRPAGEVGGMTRTLVLGGTHFVGHAIVEAALARGYDVTTLTRGASGPPPTGVTARHADRTDPVALAAALGDESWDLVADTWSGAPRVVRDSARLLSGRVGHYAYVSSRSVYEWPIPVGADESAPVVDADPDGPDSDDYSAAKRGGELAVQRDSEGPALLARAGLILGPREDVGRLPWWLRRMAAGGPVPCPGPRDRPLQYIDARDLAGWLLDASARGVTGAYNAVSRPGHTTIGELLDLCREVTGSRADLVWVTPEDVEAAGVAPWTELPIWLPPSGEYAGLHAGDVSAAYAAGLTCRPVAQTVGDTWAWMRDLGETPSPDRPAPGMSHYAEARLLARADGRS